MDCLIKIVVIQPGITIASVHSLRSLGQAYGRISLRSKAAPINLPSMRGVSRRKRFVMKILGFITISIVTLVVASYLYVFRDQDIRIDYIPQKFEYCGKVIVKGNSEYDEVVKVLMNNRDGWVTSFVSYVPTRVYSSSAFRVNVLGKMVVVSY